MSFHQSRTEGAVTANIEHSVPDLCMATPPQACHCGQCVQRSRLTNREVAGIEVERDRALDQLEGAVEALRDILDIESDGIEVGGIRAADVMKQIAADALNRLGGRSSDLPGNVQRLLDEGLGPHGRR